MLCAKHQMIVDKRNALIIMFANASVDIVSNSDGRSISVPDFRANQDRNFTTWDYKVCCRYWTLGHEVCSRTPMQSLWG
jgi:hypothetical protein